ncbi:hypothetical protein [Flexibacterium corallicola]|uniref:hypothetical protein n=1 Tax=Flexibacterium corallicola TaxID=3037259 RepID=UPI00286F8427|nr:hypothetical protein [Pseudovibrio sp. M1P-2-3]
MADPLQALLGIKFLHLAAGFMGGLVRSIVHPRTSFAYTMGTTTVGALFAAYMTPLAVPLLQRWAGGSDASLEGAAGFLLGLCGLALAEGLVKIARRWRDNPSLRRMD